MSYAAELKSILAPIQQDRYYREICRDIDALGRRMEESGYLPADIRKFLRRVIGLFGGTRMADYLFEFFINRWTEGTLEKAEDKFDRSRFQTSFGLLWTLTIEPGGEVDRCRQYVDLVMAHPQPTIEEFNQRRKAEEERIRQVWVKKGMPLPDEWSLYPDDY